MKYHNILNYRYKLHSIIKESYTQYYYPCKWDDHTTIAHYSVSDIQAWILREAIHLRIILKTYLDSHQLPFHLGLMNNSDNLHTEWLFNNTALKISLHKNMYRFNKMHYEYGLYSNLHIGSSVSARVILDITRYVNNMIETPLHNMLYDLIEQRYLMYLYQYCYENNDDRTHFIDDIMHKRRSNLALS
jgi:hypothetical protein